jgi:hypothetical protein
MVYNEYFSIIISILLDVLRLIEKSALYSVFASKSGWPERGGRPGSAAGTLNSSVKVSFPLFLLLEVDLNMLSRWTASSQVSRKQNRSR